MTHNFSHLRSVARWFACGALLLAAGCQTPTPRAYPPTPCPPMAYPPGPAGDVNWAPLPYMAGTPLAPVTAVQPWPSEEYLRDGGDGGSAADVTVQREVRGLDAEDTIAAFDTPAGNTLLQPSNRVYLYSPRFCSVRQVVNLGQSEQMDRFSGMAVRQTVGQQEARNGATQSTQNQAALGNIARDQLTQLRMREGEGAISANVGPMQFRKRFQAFENFTLIRAGRMDMTEMAMLAKHAANAVVWSKESGVQVTLNGQNATAVTKNQNVEVIYTVDEPPACPRLRVVKVASTPFANPGELVSFTIRFDNVGNQTLSKVTLLDNLTPRLEYVPDSAQSSVPATFTTKENEGGSLVLRWEAKEPIKPGDGGIVRFNCRVR